MLRAAATAAGARAWIFGAAHVDDYFVEFIEWQSPANQLIIDRAEIADALNALNAAFPFEESATWMESKL